MPNLLETAIADILNHPGGTQELADTLRGLAVKGAVEPFFKNGEYGFRLTQKGERQRLLCVEVQGHA